MMTTKMATTGLLKLTVFWNKDYDIIILVDDVTNKISSCDSNYIVDVLMWPKLGNSSNSKRKVITTSIFKDLTRKTAFFEGWSWFKFNDLGLALGTNLTLDTRYKLYTSVAKGLKSKVRKFWRLILKFVEVTRKKLVGGPSPQLILNSAKNPIFCTPLAINCWSSNRFSSWS